MFVAWLNFGAPNPRGLGYLSKGIEIVLIVALAVRLWADVQVHRVAAYASGQGVPART